MIKLVFCLRRLPHLSRGEFQCYWLDSHGPLVRDLAPALGVEGRDAGRRLLEDERRFIDLAHTPIWFGKEHALADL
jgi:hypothetical protein